MNLFIKTKKTLAAIILLSLASSQLNAFNFGPISPSINTIETKNKFALHKACQENNLEEAEWLIKEENADVNEFDDKGKTPLYYATLDKISPDYSFICNKKLQLVQLLLDNGADLTNYRKKFFYSDQNLFEVICGEDYYGECSDLIKLLAKYCNPKNVNDSHRCFYHALLNHDFETIEAILNTIIPDHDLLIKMLNTVCYRKDYGAPNAPGPVRKEHNRHLYSLSREERKKEEKRAKQQFDEYIKPIWQKCAKETVKIIELLISKGVDVNACHGEGITETPLRIACENNNLEAVKCLVENGAKINGFNAPLITACWKQNIEIIKFLIDHGADVNIIKTYSDNTTESPIELALLRGNFEMVTLLAENGAIIHQSSIIDYPELYEFDDEESPAYMINEYLKGIEEFKKSVDKSKFIFDKIDLIDKAYATNTANSNKNILSKSLLRFALLRMEQNSKKQIIYQKVQKTTALDNLFDDKEKDIIFKNYCVERNRIKILLNNKETKELYFKNIKKYNLEDNNKVNKTEINILGSLT